MIHRHEVFSSKNGKEIFFKLSAQTSSSNKNYRWVYSFGIYFYISYSGYQISCALFVASSCIFASLWTQHPPPPHTLGDCSYHRWPPCSDEAPIDFGLYTTMCLHQMEFHYTLAYFSVTIQQLVTEFLSALDGTIQSSISIWILCKFVA